VNDVLTTVLGPTEPGGFVHRPSRGLAVAIAVGALVAMPLGSAALPPAYAASGSGTVLATIAVGPRPQDAVVSPDGRFAYLTTLDDGRLTEIDLVDLAVTRSLQVGVTAGAIVWVGSLLVVADAASGNLVTVNPTTFEIEGSVPTGADPIALSVSGDASTLVFSGWEARSIGVVDLGSGRSSLLSVDGKPWGIDLFADDTRAAIADTSNGRVVIATIGTTSETIATVDVGGRPSYIAVAPDERVAYVANADNGTVDVVDLESLAVVDSFVVGGKPWGVAVSADGRYVYVPDNSGGTLIAIDARTGSVVSVTPTGTFPDFVALSPDGALVLVPNSGSGTLSVVQGHSEPGGSVATPGEDPSSGAGGTDDASGSEAEGSAEAQDSGLPVLGFAIGGGTFALLATAAVLVLLLRRRAAPASTPGAAPTEMIRLEKSPGVRLTKD